METVYFIQTIEGRLYALARERPKPSPLGKVPPVRTLGAEEGLPQYEFAETLVIT